MKKLFIGIMAASSFSFVFGQLSAPVLNFPASQSTNTDVNVRLTWSPSLGGTVTGYTAELSLDSAFTTPVTLPVYGTTAKTDKLLFNTKYFWRVKALGIGSSISAYSTINSFTTFYNQFSNLYPKDTLVTPKVSLHWDTLSGVTTYEYQYSLDTLFATFTALTSTHPVNAPSLDQLVFNTKYFWRVRASHSNDTSGWSAVNQFTVIDSVVLQFPLAGAIGQAPAAKLSCTNTPGVTEYRFEIDNSALFDVNSPDYKTATVLDANFPNPDNIVWTTSGLLFGQTYFWRVQAINSKGVSGWSQVRSFTTLDKVTLKTPTDGKTKVPNKTTLTWTLIGGVQSYEIYLDQSPTFSNPMTWIRTNDSVTTTLTDFSSAYFWRVRAIHSTDTSGWSDVWTFEAYPVGIQDVLTSSNVLLYPNPVGNILIVSGLPELKSGANCQVYTMDGRLVWESMLSGQSNTGLLEIDVHSLDRGAFVLRVRSGEKDLNFQFFKN